MSRTVLQRDRYDSVAGELAVWWTLRREPTKGKAVCRMFTHVFGHGLRLEVRGQQVESQLCRSAGGARLARYHGQQVLRGRRDDRTGRRAGPRAGSRGGEEVVTRFWRANGARSCTPPSAFPP
jgi:hypothetical protein